MDNSQLSPVQRRQVGARAIKRRPLENFPRSSDEENSPNLSEVVETRTEELKPPSVASSIPGSQTCETDEPRIKRKYTKKNAADEGWLSSFVLVY